MKNRSIRNIVYLFLGIFLVLSISVINLKAATNYIITNKQDFIDYLLADNVDMEGSYTLTTNLDFTTGLVTYKGELYNLSERQLTISPIGETKDGEGKVLSSYYNPFVGTFNGGGYVIRGLNIKSNSEDNEYVGLFGYNQGIISNIGLVDSTVEGGIHVGGIAGYNMGIIVGCYNTSSITGIGTVGGITGINYGYIRSSYNTGYVGGATKVGGIVGQNSSVISAVYDLGIISGEINEDGRKEFGYIFGYNTEQGVIGYLESNDGLTFYNPLQKYSIAGAYYSTEYDLGVGYNNGYTKEGSEEVLYDNVLVIGKTLNELKNINTYDDGFINAKSNIKPIGSDLIHQTTGFYIRQNSEYNFPVVGTNEYTTKDHVENSLKKNGFDGSGTIYNPYLIKDEKDLLNISKSLTSAYKVVNNITLSDEFIPIGEEDNEFKGILNGNGKRILNFTINTDQENEYIGLFAFNSGIIHNISVDVNINAPNASKIGGVAGFNNGYIYESYVLGSITGQTTIGGIVGTNELGRIKNSYNLANISGNIDVGGIAGFNSGTVEFVYSSTIPQELDASISKNIGTIIGYNENTSNLHNVQNAVFYGNYQIGYQTSVSGPYSNAFNKLTNNNELTVISSFPNFAIEEVPSGQVGSTIWSLEIGVNNNMPYLTKTPHFRVESILVNKDKELFENGNKIKLFTDDEKLIVGLESDSYGNQINLDELIIVLPENAENKKINYVIVSGNSFVSIDGSILSGVMPGTATIKAVSEDGSKEALIEVVIRNRVNELSFVDELDNVYPEEIEVENFSSFYLFAKTNLEIPINITWEIGSNNFLIQKENGLFETKYLNPSNLVVAGKYQNEEKVVITITSDDNSGIKKSITIKIKPSSITYTDDLFKLFEDSELLAYDYLDGKIRLKNDHLIKHDNEFVLIEFNNKFLQQISLLSENVNIEDLDALRKKLILTKGDIVDNQYINRTNVIQVTITAEDGSVENLEIELTKALSNVVDLSEITFNDGNENYTYDRINNRFIIKDVVPYEVETIFLDAKIADPNSKTHKFFYYQAGGAESSVGEITPRKESGKEIIYLRVEAEDGSSKVYEIEYTINFSEIDTLEDLFIGEYGKDNKIDFASDTLDYVIILDINDPFDYFLNYKTITGANTKVFVTINNGDPILENNISFTAGYGYASLICIFVQSEYNYLNNIDDYNIYVISVIREQNSEAELAEISVNDEEIIVKNNMEYFVDSEIDNAIINLKVSIFANVEVTFLSFTDAMSDDIYNYNRVINPVYDDYVLELERGGVYKVKIKVTSEDGSNINEYYLDIIKEPSTNSHFSKIVIDGVEYSLLDTDLFTYDNATNTYIMNDVVEVDYDKASVKFIGYLDEYAYYVFIGDFNNYFNEDVVNLDLSTGINSFEIMVFAEDIFYSTNYAFEIKRNYNPNTLYKVEHHKQNFDGTYYLDLSENFYDYAYEYVEAIDQNFVGFTFDPTINGSILEGIILEDGSLVLKLYYKRNNYNLVINYDSNFGNYYGDSGSIKYGYNVYLKAEPMLGYEFIGWYAEDKLVSSNAIYDFSMPDSDLILEARFNNSSYTIDYVLDGGSNSIDNKTNYTIYDLDIDLHAPTKDGYQFMGWYLNSSYSGNKVEKITIDLIGDITLYARWAELEKVNYQVHHYLESLAGNYELFEVENFSDLTGIIVNASSKTYLGFTYLEAISITSGEVLGDGSLVLELYYERNTYNLEINNLNPDYGTITGDSGSIKFEEEVNLVATANQGYRFLGWFKEDELVSDENDYTFLMPANDLNIIAKFEIIEYSINYMLDGGVNNQDNKSKYTINDLAFGLLEPTKAGHTFMGWYLDSGYSGEEVTEITIDLLGDLTLYSKWKINEYTVTLIVDGLIQEELIVEFNQKIDFPDLSKRGYNLDGWYTDTEYLNSWEVNNVVTEDINLHAKYELIEYQITYHEDGGTVVDGKVNPDKYTVISPELIIHPLEKLGYEFLGWYDSDGNLIEKIETNSIGDYELYASFEILKYKITFNIDGIGSVNIPGYTIKNDEVIVEYGSRVEMMLVPSLDFELTSLSINGIDQPINLEYVFENVTEDYVVEIVFEGTEPDQLILKEDAGHGNREYSIDRTNDDALFLNYYLKQTVEDIRNSFVNRPDRIKFYNLNDEELTNDKSLGTGYVIRLYNTDFTEVLDEVHVVLFGDTNGDGQINAVDINNIFRHLKLVTPIVLTPFLYGANPSESGRVTAVDINTIYRHLKLLTPLYN